MPAGSPDVIATRGFMFPGCSVRLQANHCSVRLQADRHGPAEAGHYEYEGERRISSVATTRAAAARAAAAAGPASRRVVAAAFAAASAVLDALRIRQLVAETALQPAAQPGELRRVEAQVLLLRHLDRHRLERLQEGRAAERPAA